MPDVPAQLGRYKVQKLLATGGMGEVFLARHEGPAGFSKQVVLKRVLAHLAREPEFIQMFLDEARLAAVLTHPNIVQIHELAEDSGTWFIAMEFLDGRSLRTVREKLSGLGRDMDPVQAARIMSQALDGLAYAHGLAADGKPLNIVHRDVSPDNVFVGFNGVVKVLDFGIAKAANAITTTRTGMVKGKAAFMPPEQLLAQPIDGRADVYAAGVVLYQLLSGLRPFEAPSDAALIQKILTAAPEPLKPRAPHVPDALCALVMKALAKTPANRFQSAAEFSSALERIVAASGVPNTNAETGAWMRMLFHDELNPGAPPPAPVSAVPPSVHLRPLQLTNPLPRLPTPQLTPAPTELIGTEVDPQDLARGALGEADRADFAREEGLFGPAAPALAPSHGGAREELFDRPPRGMTSIADEESAPPGAGTQAVGVAEALELELARPVHVEAAPEPEGPPPEKRRSRVPLVGVLLVVAALAAAFGVMRQRSTLKVAVPDLVVTSEPSGATLRIGEETVGPTPWAGSNAWVGTVPWELSAPGYQKKKGTFRGGQAVRLDVTLQKK